jgi:hypothetical protein
MRDLIYKFESELVFNGISTTDQPKAEFLNLLARWCYCYDTSE